MLEFTYDGKYHLITASVDCTIDFAIVGAGGGGGGADAGHQGGYGLSGERVTGSVFVQAGHSIYCVIGSGGLAGQSNVRGGQGGIGGWGEGYVGFVFGGFGGGTGGSSGPSGASGSGGGGGGATTVRYYADYGFTNLIAVAGGGGGGGGAGNYSNGYTKSPHFYLGVPGGDVAHIPGGKGQDHQGDGGGPGGGGGGFVSGAGGVQPDGDNGAMSGSSGSNYGSSSLIPSADFLSFLSYYGTYISAGTGGNPGMNGQTGYAIFSSKQTSLYTKATVLTNTGFYGNVVSEQWLRPSSISVRNGQSWTAVTDVYVRVNNAWTRVYGDNIPTTSADVAAMGNITGPAIPYPPPIEVPVIEYVSTGGDTATGGFDAPGDAAAASDGGGGGGGGGKIICTKLYELGLMSEEIYLADQAFGAELVQVKPDIYNGYRAWAEIVVDWMDGKGPKMMPWMSDEKFSSCAKRWSTTWANDIATPWAEEMAHHMGKKDTGSLTGKMLTLTGIPICKAVGVWQRAFGPSKKPAGFIKGSMLIAIFVMFKLVVELGRLIEGKKS